MSFVRPSTTTCPLKNFPKQNYCLGGIQVLGTHREMPRLIQIYKIAEQHKLPVSAVFKEYILTPEKRLEIGKVLDMEPYELDQMCDTPPSQKKLLSFF